MSLQFFHDCLLAVLADIAMIINAVQQIAGADVGCHDQDGVLKVHRPPLGIGNPPIIQHLEQYVEYVRMSLFYLIEQDHGIWLPADRLG